MKNTKKLVALVVTILMLATFATSTFPVFAEADTSKAFTVGDTGYDNFSDAVTAAYASADHILYLNADVSVQRAPCRA